MDPNRALIVPYDAASEQENALIATNLSSSSSSLSVTGAGGGGGSHNNKRKIDPTTALAKSLCGTRGKDTNGPAVRSGSLTVMNIGMPRIDVRGFHTKHYIFPHYYRSTRIFWSMVTPGT